MLSISTIARVIVNASRAVSAPTSFDTGLLIRDGNFTAPKRTGPPTRRCRSRWR